MRRIIVTGANGAGKTAFARRLAAARPDLPLVHFDALKLERDWQQRSRAGIETRLRAALTAPGWILEGGPSLLPTALPNADAVVWLDPPTLTRARRLATRPWTSLGKTRAELPEGNPDRLGQQYAFAWRSLMQSQRFRDTIASSLIAPATPPVFICRTARDGDAALAALGTDGTP